MPEIRRCADCGRPLTSDAPEGFCPACMLQGALDLGVSTLDVPVPSPKRFGDYELLDISRPDKAAEWKCRLAEIENPQIEP